MATREQARIVIIGGGAIGLSVAYHLGRLGINDVVLLERNQLTSGTSWHAAGIVGPLRASMNLTRLARYALELFVELEHEGGGLTIWPQDPFLVLRGPAGQVRLLASNSFERAGDDRMAAAFAEALSAPVEVSNLSFEGGNIVSDERRVFIGANTIRSNAVAMSLGESEVVRIFEAELGHLPEATTLSRLVPGVLSDIEAWLDERGFLPAD